MSAPEYLKEKAPSPGGHESGVYAEDTVPDHALVRQLKGIYLLSISLTRFLVACRHLEINDWLFFNL